MVDFAAIFIRTKNQIWGQAEQAIPAANLSALDRFKARAEAQHRQM